MTVFEVIFCLNNYNNKTLTLKKILIIIHFIRLKGSSNMVRPKLVYKSKNNLMKSIKSLLNFYYLIIFM